MLGGVSPIREATMRVRAVLLAAALAVPLTIGTGPRGPTS